VAGIKHAWVFLRHPQNINRAKKYNRVRLLYTKYNSPSLVTKTVYISTTRLSIIIIIIIGIIEFDGISGLSDL